MKQKLSVFATFWILGACGGAPGLEEAEESPLLYAPSGVDGSLTDDLTGRYPHVGFIRKVEDNGELRQSCTATLIAPDVAITAAHCVEKRPAAELLVAFNLDGIRNEISGISTNPIQVTDLWLHPQRLATQTGPAGPDWVRD